jgi:hypothetical protein
MKKAAWGGRVGDGGVRRTAKLPIDQASPYSRPMYGSTLTKLGRIACDFAASPSNIPRYVRQSIGRQSPLDLALPWFSFGAIDFLADWLRPDMVAYEYGSGGSTLFLAGRVKAVVSIEDDPTWEKMVGETLRRGGYRHRMIGIVPVEGAGPDCPYVTALPSEPADVIIVDGLCRWPERCGLRARCFVHAETAIKPGGIIVLDDSWRYPDAVAKARAKHHRRFQGVGPARPGVTSTDIFFY